MSKSHPDIEQVNLDLQLTVSVTSQSESPSFTLNSGTIIAKNGRLTNNRFRKGESNGFPLTVLYMPLDTHLPGQSVTFRQSSCALVCIHTLPYTAQDRPTKHAKSLL